MRKSTVLTAEARTEVNKQLELLGLAPLSDGPELTLASAVRRARGLRDSTTMVTLTVSALTLAVAVVVGSMGSNAYVGLILICYLVGGGILVIGGAGAMRLATTAEVVRVVVERRLEIAKDVAVQDTERDTTHCSKSWWNQLWFRRRNQRGVSL